MAVPFLSPLHGPIWRSLLLLLLLQIRVFVDFAHFEEQIEFRVEYSGEPLTAKENLLLSATHFERESQQSAPSESHSSGSMSCDPSGRDAQ